MTVVAPADQRSGTGGQTTEGELEVTDTELASGYPAKAVDGFPADTVRVAIDEMGLEPDVVVAGINEGQNLGPLVDVSGTVGAARAAVARGVPALAVSSGIADDVDYEAAVPFVLEWVDSHRTVFVEGTAPDEVANMNVPSCATGQVKEPVEVPLATASEGAVAPSDCESTLTDPPDDITAFNAGYADRSTADPPIPRRNRPARRPRQSSRPTARGSGGRSGRWGSSAAWTKARARAVIASRSNGSRSSSSSAGQAAVEEVGDGVAQVVGDRVAGEVPDDRAHLELDREREAVVDAPDVAVGVDEAVPALAVGVVGDQVEGAHALELRVVAPRPPAA